MDCRDGGRDDARVYSAAHMTHIKVNSQLYRKIDIRILKKLLR
jgi:hypothetical protein